MPPRISNSSARCIGRALPTQNPQCFSRPPAIPWLTRTSQASSQRHYASAVSPIPLGALRLPDDYIPPTKPPSARRPETRKSQLLRAYTALLRSTPLILFFQHNNVTAVEWAAVRRELRKALQEVEAPFVASDGKVPADVAGSVELQVLRTRIFDIAFRVVEFFDPKIASKQSKAYTHDLSPAAYESIKAANLADPNSTYATMSPLLSGPVCAVTFPAVSPAHLAAVLKIMAPSPPAFPAPTRRKNPGYYELTAQSGLQKLLLIGGRIEGKAFDGEGVKWVGGIEGGMEGLRAQLVHMLQSAGLGLATTLEGGAKGLWLALEGRRTQLDEEKNPKQETAEAEAEKKE
ncbi:uncharacterized protein BCR38DRAFT_438311 [Pseudomassariella vexata]|uniref:Uncharacterized protein n=1 Tax=Pseudomassariella vexata TaxID=1141098 RepID=A0A1Y2DSX3_9PEZI|nr:uncharacterized protein BCR38DRAFT_438311 [Pseudomassariella vexata]ORY62378.1 hypothetical protein BCR38DRAFT_438311 [Pseudomassariella vexata]